MSLEREVRIRKYWVVIMIVYIIVNFKISFGCVWYGVLWMVGKEFLLIILVGMVKLKVILYFVVFYE